MVLTSYCVTGTAKTCCGLFKLLKFSVDLNHMVTQCVLFSIDVDFVKQSWKLFPLECSTYSQFIEWGLVALETYTSTCTL